MDIKIGDITRRSARESKKIGNRALHEARTAGESLSKLREAYWQEAHGGEKKGWKEYLIEEYANVLPVGYDIMCTYISVYVNWDIIVDHGWNKLTYEQVAEGLLPRYEWAKPIPTDDD